MSPHGERLVQKSDPADTEDGVAVDPVHGSTLACRGQSMLAEFCSRQSGSSEEARRIAAHLAICPACRADLELLEDRETPLAIDQLRTSADASDTGMEEEPVPKQMIEAIYALGDATRSLKPEGLRSESPSPTQLWCYEIRERLGAGAFGVVYRAEDVRLHRSVALKLPLSGALADPSTRAWFLREAQAVARLHHPQIVELYDVGEVDGIVYLASAFCPGLTLSEWIKRAGGPIPADEAAEVIVALCEAAQHAHERGVLHRDIKPQNVLLDSTMRFRRLAFTPKLNDFGVARILEASTDGLGRTVTAGLIGTPRYMSPEQASGGRDEIGVASDVYAIGVVLYELLTGSAPIRGDGDADTLRRIVAEEPMRLRRRNPTIPRDLEAICLKCLEKSPQRRFASARDLSDELNRFLRREPTHTRPLAIPVRATRWVRRHPAGAGLIGVVGLAALALVGGLALFGETQRRHNWQLGTVNRELKSALEQAQSATGRAVVSEKQTQDLLYVADMRLAARARQDGDVRLLASILDRYKPRQDRQGSSDHRGVEWHFLHRFADTPHTVLDRSAEPIYCLATTPDGRRLAAAGKDATIRLFDLADGARGLTIDTQQREVNSVAFSPEGNRLASAGDDGSICIWDLRDGRLLKRIAAYDRLAFMALWIAEGKQLVSCGSSPTIRLWDADTGAAAGELVGHQGAIESIAVSPDGLGLASCGADRTLRLWRLPDGKPLTALETERDVTVNVVRFSPDGRWLATGDERGHFWVCDAATGAIVDQAQTLDGIRSVAFADDSTRVAVGDAAGVFRLWQLVPEGNRFHLSPLRQWQGHQNRVFDSRFTEANRLITAGGDGAIISWQVGDPHGRPGELPELRAAELTFVDDDRLVAIDTGEMTVRTFAGETLHQLGSSSRITICRDGSRLAAIDQAGALTLWDLSRLTKVATSLPARIESFKQFTLSPDGTRLAIWTVDPVPRLRVFRVDDGSLIGSLTPPDEPTTPHLAFSEDNSRVAFDYLNDLWLWDLAKNSTQRVATAHNPSILAIAFSRDDTLLATAGADRLVKLWDPHTLAPLATLAGHRASVRFISFTSDSRTLVSVSADGVVMLWSAAAREALFELDRITNDPIVFARMSPGDRRLAVVKKYGAVVVIPIRD